MDAPIKRTIFELIKNNEDNLIFKLIIFAKINSTEAVLDLFTNTIKKYPPDVITGLLLMSPTFILCLIESVENIIYEFSLSLLNNDRSNILEVCRHFPIHFSDTGRFFSQWYSKEISWSKSVENSADGFEDLKKIYKNAIEKIYQFYWELKSADVLEEQLELLSREGSVHLPSIDTMELLISNWGCDLKKLVDNYYGNLEPEDDIWPVQKIQTPSFDFYNRSNKL